MQSFHLEWKLDLLGTGGFLSGFVGVRRWWRIWEWEEFKFESLGIILLNLDC